MNNPSQIGGRSNSNPRGRTRTIAQLPFNVSFHPRPSPIRHAFWPSSNPLLQVRPTPTQPNVHLPRPPLGVRSNLLPPLQHPVRVYGGSGQPLRPNNRLVPLISRQQVASAHISQNPRIQGPIPQLPPWGGQSTVPFNSSLSSIHSVPFNASLSSIHEVSQSPRSRSLSVETSLLGKLTGTPSSGLGTNPVSGPNTSPRNNQHQSPLQTGKSLHEVFAAALKKGEIPRPSTIANPNPRTSSLAENRGRVRSLGQWRSSIPGKR